MVVAGVLLLPACGGSRDIAPEDAPRLYVSSGFTDEVHVLDARNGATIRTIGIDRRRGEVDEPHGLAVSPDGRHWYATLSHGNPTLWKYETADDRLVGRLTLNTAGASRVGLTPDGTRAFIPDYWRGGLGQASRVAVIDLHDLMLVDAPVVCPAPHHAEVDPTGELVAIACALSDEIVLMDAGSLEIRSRFPVGSDPGEAGTPLYKPMNVVWAPDGSTFYATMMQSSEVRAFTRLGEPAGVVSVGAMPAQIARSADGRVLMVANRGDESGSVLDPETLEEVRRIQMPGAAFPHGIALDPAGEVAYVSYEGEVGGRGGVVAIDIGTGEVLWRRELGIFTLGVAYLPRRQPPRTTKPQS